MHPTSSQKFVIYNKNEEIIYQKNIKEKTAKEYYENAIENFEVKDTGETD